MRRLVTTVAACLVSAGCYTYRPLPGVDASMPAAGTKVEARLTKAGSERLGPKLGQDVESVAGTVLAADSNAVSLAVEATETAHSGRIDWRGEHVSLPREDIATLGFRRLSVPMTALVGGIAGGGIVAAAAIFGGNGSANIPSTAGGSGTQ